MHGNVLEQHRSGGNQAGRDITIVKNKGAESSLDEQLSSLRTTQTIQTAMIAVCLCLIALLLLGHSRGSGYSAAQQEYLHNLISSAENRLGRRIEDVTKERARENIIYWRENLQPECLK